MLIKLTKSKTNKKSLGIHGQTDSSSHQTRHTAQQHSQQHERHPKHELKHNTRQHALFDSTTTELSYTTSPSSTITARHLHFTTGSIRRAASLHHSASPALPAVSPGLDQLPALAQSILHACGCTTAAAKPKQIRSSNPTQRLRHTKRGLYSTARLEPAATESILESKYNQRRDKATRSRTAAQIRIELQTPRYGR